MKVENIKYAVSDARDMLDEYIYHKYQTGGPWPVELDEALDLLNQAARLLRKVG